MRLSCMRRPGIFGSAGDGGPGPLRDLGKRQRREGPVALSPRHDAALLLYPKFPHGQREANNVAGIASNGLTSTRLHML
jgi:hypothetical protein